MYDCYFFLSKYQIKFNINFKYGIPSKEKSKYSMKILIQIMHKQLLLKKLHKLLHLNRIKYRPLSKTRGSRKLVVVVLF